LEASTASATSRKEASQCQRPTQTDASSPSRAVRRRFRWQAAWRVKDIEDGYVKLDVRWGRDYWLSFEEVLSADRDKTVLIIPSDEVNSTRGRSHTPSISTMATRGQL
jgi:hypothetical protein